MRILELENWRVRSLLLVPLGLKSILNYKPVLMVGPYTRVGSFCSSYLFSTIHTEPLLVFNGLCVRL
jgi:uncharacterized membrane protein YfcA